MMIFGVTCRRCGVHAHEAGTPYTLESRTSEEDGTRATVVYFCQACGRDFASDEERAEYVRLQLLA